MQKQEVRLEESAQARRGKALTNSKKGVVPGYPIGKVSDEQKCVVDAVGTVHSTWAAGYHS
jgi:hypothetical protein